MSALTTPILGGHAVCMFDAAHSEKAEWHSFYNQKQLPACVGFSSAHMMSLYNGREYDGAKLYQTAHAIDGISGPQDGTTVRAAFDVLRTVGPTRVNAQGKCAKAPSLKDGITENRWAKLVDVILAAFDFPGASAIPILNSWGTDYPHVVYMDAEIIHHELTSWIDDQNQSYCEAMFATDQPGPKPPKGGS